MISCKSHPKSACQALEERADRYLFEYHGDAYEDSKEHIEHLIESEGNKLDVGTGSEDHKRRLVARQENYGRAWVFDNYVVTSCGTRLMFCQRKDRLDAGRR